MNSRTVVPLAVGGALIAFGLAAVTALAPEPTPRLIASPMESHDHHPYHPPINTPYATAVDLCLDRPATVRIVEATVRGGAPALKEFGPLTDGTVVVTTECPTGHGDGAHGIHGERVRVVLEGQSPEGANRTPIHLTYTVDGYDGVHETEALLPALHHRPV